MLLLVYLIFKSKRHGQIADADPWNAYTLEWATTSPPQLKNFEDLPAVTSRRAWWDIKQNTTKTNS